MLNSKDHDWHKTLTFGLEKSLKFTLIVSSILSDHFDSYIVLLSTVLILNEKILESNIKILIDRYT